MKKRSACKIIAGLITLGMLATGHCGRVTLQGVTDARVSYVIEVAGVNADDPTTTYELGYGCGVCMSYTGPCINANPQDVSVVGRDNVSTLRAIPGRGYAGTGIQWRAARTDTDNRVTVRVTCDNHAKPEWPWVTLGLHRGDWTKGRYDLALTATNADTGATEVRTWDRTAVPGWNPSWGVARATGGGGGVAAGVSYPDTVELRGKNARARILYDVRGNTGITARIDKIPEGLSCSRTSDGLSIAPSVSVGVRPGDSISCTNVRSKIGHAADSLSVTAMIR